MDGRLPAAASSPPPCTGSAPLATLPVRLPIAFRDSVSLRERAQLLGLSRLQADFARCLAFCGWLGQRPLRRLWLRPPSPNERDDQLLALLRNAGWPLRSFDDELLGGCWELRWEFVPARLGAPARFRNGPSYHDRLRLDLLVCTWERLVADARADNDALTLLTRRLAEASAAFRPGFGLPLELLERSLQEHLDEAAREDAARLEPRVRAASLASATRELAPLLTRLAQSLWASPV